MKYRPNVLFSTVFLTLNFIEAVAGGINPKRKISLHAQIGLNHPKPMKNLSFVRKLFSSVKFGCKLLLLSLLTLSCLPKTESFGQAPALSYSSPQNYNVGTAIPTLTPTSSGVAAPGFSGTSTTIGPVLNVGFGLAVDAAGNFYIGDTNDNKVYKMPANGSTPVSI